MAKESAFQFRILSKNWALTRDYPSTNKEGAVVGETETPKFDLYETEKDIVIEADLPGIDPQEIRAEFLNNQLTLEGKREPCSETGHFIRMERCLEDFRRIIPLPCTVDPQRSKASYDKGVLTLRLPKIVERRRKMIKIDINNR